MNKDYLKKCLIPCLGHKMYKKSLKYLVLEMRKLWGIPWWYSGGDFHSCGLENVHFLWKMSLRVT